MSFWCNLFSKRKEEIDESCVLGIALMIGLPDCIHEPYEAANLYKNINPSWSGSHPVSVLCTETVVPDVEVLGPTKVVKAILSSDYANSLGECTVFVQTIVLHLKTPPRQVDAALCTFCSSSDGKKKCVMIPDDSELKFQHS